MSKLSISSTEPKLGWYKKHEFFELPLSCNIPSLNKFAKTLD